MHTGRTTTVAKRIMTILEGKIGDTGFSTPAIAGVSYGDQLKVPSVPWVCIEPQTKNREWPPTMTDMTVIDHEVTVYVYHANVPGGKEETRMECDDVAEAIEEHFNMNERQLNDALGSPLVIYGYFISNEGGYTYKGTSLYRAARMTWRGKVKVPLRQAG